jgi:hypothetical protein
MHLLLLLKGDTLQQRVTCIIPLIRDVQSHVHLPLVTEVGTSPILHKLRHTAKMLILFTFPASDPPSLMQTCLTLPDERRPPTGTSPIRVYH